jgi:phosphohistidine phosphatase SixA
MKLSVTPVQATRGPSRRRVLTAALAWPAVRAASADGDVQTLLREGGVVIAFRHALAPGTFDPLGFKLDDCSTQRNLNDEGRAQARHIGEWFNARALQPARVRSSPWCRCVETAALAFGRVETWAALGSPRGAGESSHDASLRELRQTLATVTAQRGRFEVWVTHMFVLSDLAGANSSSGEGLVLRADGSGAAQVLARLATA